MKSEDSTQKLEEVRELIDSLDQEIIMLLRQRSGYVDMVATIKKEAGLPVYQPTRFALMVDQLQALAKDEGLDTELVAEIWDAIHESSQRQQNATLKKS